MNKMFYKAISLCLGVVMAVSALPITTALGTTSKPNNTTSVNNQQVDLSSSFTNELPKEGDNIVYDKDGVIVYETGIETDDSDRGTYETGISELLPVVEDGVSATEESLLAELAQANSDGVFSTSDDETTENSDVETGIDEELPESEETFEEGVFETEEDDRDLALAYLGIGYNTLNRNAEYGFRPPSTGQYKFSIVSGSGNFYVAGGYRSSSVTLTLSPVAAGKYYAVRVENGTQTARVLIERYQPSPSTTMLGLGTSTVVKGSNYGFRPTSAGEYTFTMTSNASSNWQIAGGTRNNPVTLNLSIPDQNRHYAIYVPGSGNCNVNITKVPPAPATTIIGLGTSTVVKGRKYGFKPTSAGEYTFTMTYNASSNWEIAGGTRSNPVTLNLSVPDQNRFYAISVPGSGNCNVNITKVPAVTMIGLGTSTVVKGRNYGFRPTSAGEYTFTMTSNASSNWQIAGGTRSNPVSLNLSVPDQNRFYAISVPGSGNCNVSITKVPEVTMIGLGTSTVVKGRKYGFRPTSAGEYTFTMTYNASSNWEIAGNTRSNPVSLNLSVPDQNRFYAISVPGSGNCNVNITKVPDVTIVGVGTSNIVKGRTYGFKTDVAGVYEFKMISGASSTWHVGGADRTNPIKLRLAASGAGQHYKILVPGSGSCTISIDLLVEEGKQPVYWTKRYSFTPKFSSNYTFSLDDVGTVAVSGVGTKNSPAKFSLTANVKYTITLTSGGRNLSATDKTFLELVRENNSSKQIISGYKASANTHNDHSMVVNAIAQNGVNTNYFSHVLNSSYCTQAEFDQKESYVKYWSGHGFQEGRLGVTDKDSVYMKSTTKFSGGNLEFLIFSACKQLGDFRDANGVGDAPVVWYANSMIDSINGKSLRVIAGYHGQGPAQNDEGVAGKFIEYATKKEGDKINGEKQNDSVKSAWIKANWHYRQNGPENNFAVLTHKDATQYSRFDGYYPNGTTKQARSKGTNITRFMLKHVTKVQNGVLVLNIGDSGADVNSLYELENAPELFENTMEVPNISLKAEARTLQFDDKTGKTSVFNHGSELVTSTSEIGNTSISMTVDQLKNKAENWVDSGYNGLESRELSVINDANVEYSAITMNDISLDQSNTDTKYEIVAYGVTYRNEYQGIPVAGDYMTILTDGDSIHYSAANWHTLKAADDRDLFNLNSKQVNFSDAIRTVKSEIAKKKAIENESFSTEAYLVNNVGLEYVLNEKNGYYQPNWVFEMTDSNTYAINCFDGEFSEITN